jgi:hypothetical protein
MEAFPLKSFAFLLRFDTALLRGFYSAQGQTLLWIVHQSITLILLQKLFLSLPEVSNIKSDMLLCVT